MASMIKSGAYIPPAHGAHDPLYYAPKPKAPLDPQAVSNAAAEKRYQDILALLANIGEQGKADIIQRGTASRNAYRQRMVSAGLGNISMGSGIDREMEADLRRLTVDLARERAGVMERKSDVGPDMGLYTNLMQQAGRYGGGGQSGYNFGPLYNSSGMGFGLYAPPGYGGSSGTGQFDTSPTYDAYAKERSQKRKKQTEADVAYARWLGKSETDMLGTRGWQQ